jgi:hypothetical protein
MKRILACALAAAALAGAVAPASAQGPRPSDWQPLSQRQDDVARRIDNGVASGALTDLQARDLRDQFQGLLNLEDDYAKTGLTLHQREDLQARYDTLAARLRVDTQSEDRVYLPAAAPDR